MAVIEHNSVARLSSLLDEMSASPDMVWGVILVNKRYLKPMTNEALMMALKPALVGTVTAHIYLDGNERFYIAWNGELKKVYRQLHGLITNALAHCEPTIRPASIMRYLNPYTHMDEIREVLKAGEKKPAQGKNSDAADDPFEGLDSFDMNEETDRRGDSPMSLMATAEQLVHYRERKLEKPHRKQLQILVAEDAPFAQKLMHEVIRGIRNRAGESPQINIVASVQEAWNCFLKKAPDICFVDLGLIGGSGHSLAQGMKEVDPACYVIVVTANDYAEEVAVARQNNVDSFLTKPYTKKQILDCIENYTTSAKTAFRPSTLQ